jgi:hypothetical protein
MGERTGVRLDATGEDSFEAFVAVAFLPLALIWFVGFRLNSGRPEFSVNKLSAVELR